MYLISLTYKVPTEEVDPHMENHISFLNDQYAKGIFLLSGRKIPRTGGIILAKCDSREKIEEIVRQDPFYQHRIVDIDIIEFNASTAAKGLESLLD